MKNWSVYSFDNYKKFIESTYEVLAESQPSLSLSSFSKQLGFGTSNYLGLILDGKRNLTTSNIHKVASALSLSFEETTYFEALVLRDQAETPKERAHYNERISRLKKEVPKSSRRINSKQLFSEWYYPVILLAADRCETSQIEKKIQSLLPLPKQTMTSILQSLLDMGLIFEEDGRYHLDGTHQIFFDTKSTSSRHKVFLEAQLNLSKVMLKNSYSKGSKFYAHTFSIEKTDLPFYQEEVRSLITKFTARSDETNPEAVMQLNVQLFDIANIPAKIFEK